MPTGRPPKPANLRALHGSRSRSNRRRSSPVGAVQRPPVPSWLNPTARRHYTELCKRAAEMGTLRLADRHLLATAASNLAIAEQCARALDEHGLTHTTANGYPTQRPEVAIKAKAETIAAGILARFGFSPTDRARMAIRDPEPPDPFDEFDRPGSSATVERYRAMMDEPDPRPAWLGQSS